MSHSSQHHIEVSSVALVDLKAEISRRQVELKRKTQKLSDGCRVIKSVSGRGKNSIWCKRKSDKEDVRKSNMCDALVEDEDKEQLERSRRTLEAKAKLYEALKAAAASGTKIYSSGYTQRDMDENILVDFEQKANERTILSRSPSPVHSPYDSDKDDRDHYPTAYSDEDWTENGDPHEKRQCTRKDVPSVSHAEESADHDGPLTYAHLREGEIRDHGVGFYAFSQDADKRETEMARLKELHRATEEGRARAQAIRIKRDARMGLRLARLRARKGLPDVATAAAQCLGEASAPPTPLPVSVDAQSDIRLGSEDLDVASMLRRLRDEAELRASLTNPVIPEPVCDPVTDSNANLADVYAAQNAHLGQGKKSREWDRGKSMISAQRYLQEEREKRLPEFAPPSLY